MSAPLFQPHELTFRSGHVLQAQALYALLPRYNFPVGFIWYAQDLVDLTNIGYIFVHEKMRRQGIAGSMLWELRLWYPKNTIVTAVCNEFSEPCFRSWGFVKEPMGWFLRLPAPEVCPMI